MFKKILLGLVLVNVLSAAFGQTEETSDSINGAQITFVEELHDFGDISQGEQVNYVFKFENTGNEPLIISNVLTSCGCTATRWPRDPIAPGKSEEIEVNFNSAGKMGRQNKVVTIVSNAINSQSRVRIVSNVLPPDRN